MFKFITSFFNYNERELNRIRKRVDEINDLEDKARKLKDNDFPKETKKLKEIIDGNPDHLSEALPLAFALTREAARRVLNQRHFDVQLIAGIALHEGKVAEQKTGEGKTLSATTALYLNALVGRGVHLVTVNDYLARRDAGWMGQIFHFLGLTTAAIISDKSFIYDLEYVNQDAADWRLSHLKAVSRKEAYQADVTYGINSEFGFDYLRDNMAGQVGQMVQRGFYYAVIDEADSVLIDEARTPHIISAPYEEDTSKYYEYAKIVRQLDVQDYIIDEKTKTSHLTEAGIQKVENILGVSNIYEKNYDTLFHVEAALKARTLFKIDRDYIVKDNEVIIVDEFTGRLLYGRRFSEGLHQAIEAKENVSIQKESKTLATVSLQNYFRMYKKLAGMTGTAATEAEELNKIYHVDTLIVPTHRKMIRYDAADMIYKTEKGKFEAVAEEIAKNYKIGRPVLVGTTSIEKNERLSGILKQKGVPHELLNAKNHLQEAAIIARAGERGVVTVATNMAGRGVDIILGGEPPSQFKVEEKKYKKQIQAWQEMHDEVVKLGGLYVIGTERHESRRIDNQLRGRSGRQGDPGETRFFVSLEDDLMRIFGGEQISKLMTFFNFPEDQPLTHSMVSKAIEQAQVKVEGFNFDIRKHLVEYDDVLNKQRDIIYKERRKILLGTDELNPIILSIYYGEVKQLINQYLSFDLTVDPELKENFKKELSMIMPFDSKKVENYLKFKDTIGLENYLDKEITREYEKREKEFPEKLWANIVKMIFLSTIDKYWTEHLTAIEDLREGINLRGYAHLDPLVEYKNEAFKMFESLMADINFEATRRLFHIEVTESVEEKETQAPSKPLVFKSASSVDPFTQKKEQIIQSESVGVSRSQLNQSKQTNEKDQVPPGQFRVILPGTTQKKIGRNDPCWCGSGKKFKKCHYPNYS